VNNPKATWLPEELLPLTNGRADYQTAVAGRFVVDGDGVHGEVVARETAPVSWTDGTRTIEVLTIRTAGGQMIGDQLEPGTWVRVRCSAKSLREWVERANPRVGDRVVLVFNGRDENVPYAPRHRWTCSVVREGDRWL
jgi:hypothetical protein